MVCQGWVPHSTTWGWCESTSSGKKTSRRPGPSAVRDWVTCRRSMPWPTCAVRNCWSRSKGWRSHGDLERTLPIPWGRQSRLLNLTQARQQPRPPCMMEAQDGLPGPSLDLPERAPDGSLAPEQVPAAHFADALPDRSAAGERMPEARGGRRAAGKFPGGADSPDPREDVKNIDSPLASWTWAGGKVNVPGVAVGDVDADGDQDVVLAGVGALGETVVLFNDGKGNFKTGTRLADK